MPRVRVITVNYNNGATLPRALAALAAQSWSDFEAVIVDNASADGSPDTALPSDPRFTLLRLPNNTGFAAANNRGADGAQTEFLALLNPDAYPSPDWLERLLSAADAHRDFVMFGSTQLLDADPRIFDGAGDAYSFFGTAWRRGHGEAAVAPYPTREVFGPCAAAALYRRAEFAAIGGFDERYFCYYEDVDLAFRLHRAGGRCLQVGDAVVRHVGSSTSSDFVRYHLVRNQIWTFVKTMPAAFLLLGLPIHVALVMRAALRDRSGGPVRRAVRDAMKGLPAILRDRRTMRLAMIAPVLSWSLKPRA